MYQIVRIGAISENEAQTVSVGLGLFEDPEKSNSRSVIGMKQKSIKYTVRHRKTRRNQFGRFEWPGWFEQSWTTESGRSGKGITGGRKRKERRGAAWGLRIGRRYWPTVKLDAVPCLAVLIPSSVICWREHAFRSFQIIIINLFFSEERQTLFPVQEAGRHSLSLLRSASSSFDIKETRRCLESRTGREHRDRNFPLRLRSTMLRVKTPKFPVTLLHVVCEGTRSKTEIGTRVRAWKRVSNHWERRPVDGRQKVGAHARLLFASFVMRRQPMEINEKRAGPRGTRIG